MSRARHALLIGMAAVVLLPLSGCVFKKKQPPVPQQGQAPTIPAPETQPVPTEQPAPPEEKPAETQPETKPEEKAATPEETAPKPKKKKPAVAKKPAPPAQPAPSQAPPAQASAQPAPAKTSKLVIQEGGAPSSQGQLAAGVTLEDPSHNKQTTEQLLQATQTNLNSLNRPLSPDEQAMVAQITDYMKQARKATSDSDPVRAHNLAIKAHLLSQELVKH